MIAKLLNEANEECLTPITHILFLQGLFFSRSLFLVLNTCSTDQSQHLYKIPKIPKTYGKIMKVHDCCDFKRFPCSYRQLSTWRIDWRGQISHITYPSQKALQSIGFYTFLPKSLQKINQKLVKIKVNHANIDFGSMEGVIDRHSIAFESGKSLSNRNVFFFGIF